METCPNCTHDFVVPSPHKYVEKFCLLCGHTEYTALWFSDNPWYEEKNHAAVALGKLGGSSTSEAKRKASAENGKKGGRKRRCHECKTEIKPGDSWERHSYGKGRYLYCGNCAERIRREQQETDRYEGRYYP